MMIDRRSFLRSAGMTACVASFAPKLTLARTPLLPGGCCLCHRLKDGYGTEGLLSSESPFSGIVRSSGDAETDRFLGMALVRLSMTFKVTPGFAFYDDKNSPNACANPDTLLETGPGTVLMGKRLFAQKMAQDRDAGVTIVAILAHEFGHIVQMQRGYETMLDRMDATQMPRELHADFLAGFYLALRKAEHGDLDLQTAGAAFNDFGDVDFNSPQHHGTSRQRTAAVTAGFNLGKSGQHDVDDVARSGAIFIQQII